MAGYVKRQLLDFSPILFTSACRTCWDMPRWRWRKATASQRWLPITPYETYLKHYWHLAWLEGFLTRALRRFYGQCREVYVPSESTRHALLADGLKDNFKPWPRGIDTARFTPAKRSLEWRTRLGIGEDELVILHVSRLVREKRLDTLTKALNQLPPSRGDCGRRAGPGFCRANCRMPSLPVPADEALATAYASSDLFIFPATAASAM
jgi:glycosyltransferase involved in cell wall biosynthesis